MPTLCNHNGIVLLLHQRSALAVHKSHSSILNFSIRVYYCDLYSLKVTTCLKLIGDENVRSWLQVEFGGFFLLLWFIFFTDHTYLVYEEMKEYQSHILWFADLIVLSLIPYNPKSYKTTILLHSHPLLHMYNLIQALTSNHLRLHHNHGSSLA